MNKVLIDTNILIYSIDEDSNYFKESQNILLNKNNNLYTTSKNITEFLTVIARHPQSSLPIQQAIEIIHDFTNIMTILYPTNHSYQILIELLKKYKPSGLKIHDFEIISIAMAHHILDIATINIKDFRDVTEINIFP